MSVIPECDRGHATHMVLFIDGWSSMAIASYHPDEFSAYRRAREINKARGREAANVVTVSSVPDETIEQMLFAECEDNIGWSF